MSDTIKNDHQLDQYAAAAARDIMEDVKQYGGEAFEGLTEIDLALDLVHEHADACEHVIYYHKAHAICQNCNTENGEAFIEECGGFGENVTYDSIAAKIAYAELRTRIEERLYYMGVE